MIRKYPLLKKIDPLNPSIYMFLAIFLAPLRSYHLINISGFNLSFFRFFVLLSVFVFFLGWFKSKVNIPSIKRIGLLFLASIVVLIAIMIHFPSSSSDMYGSDALSRTIGRSFGFLFILFFLLFFTKRFSLQLFIKAFLFSSVIPLAIGGYQIVYFFKKGHFPLLPFSEFAVVSEFGSRGLGTIYWRYPRLASTFLEPNYFGMYLSAVILITLSYYLIWENKKSHLPKTALLLICGISIVELVFTLSLSSLLGLISGLLLLFFFTKPPLKRFLKFLTILFIFVLLFNFLFAHHWNIDLFQIMKDRISLRIESNKATEELDRIPYFVGSINAFLDSPIIGVGYEALSRYTPGVVPSAHNALLTFLAAHGFLGFFPLIFFLTYIFYKLFRFSVLSMKRGDKKTAALGISLLSSLLALIVTNQLYDAMFSFDTSWVLMGLAAAYSVLPFGKMSF